MLHFGWLDEIERREYDFRKSGDKTQKPSPFDCALYEANKLPVGLSISSGIFPLQRASHARDWTPPGVENDGNPIFENMRLLVVLENETREVEW